MFDRFRALSARRQILIAAGGTVVVLMLVAGLWYGLLRPSYQVLFSQLRTGDAATIVSALERAKVPYRLANGGTTILVPADLADRTRLNLMAEDLPLKGTVGFELFDKSDMGLTDFAQKINYQRALQGELERTIGSLDGVDSARVHLSLGEDRLFQDDRVPPKASVTVRMREGHTLSVAAARGIQKLVAASVPNLEPANVVILDALGQIVNTTADSARAAIVSDSALQQERFAIEQYYEARARLSLERVYPLNTIAVQVRADMPEGRDDSLAIWTPATRDFPLRVTLSPVLPLDQAALDNIRALLGAAVGFDTEKSDQLSVTPALTADSDALPKARALRSLASDPLALPDSSGSQMPAVVIAGFVVLFVGTAFLLWRGRRPRRLSDPERQAFAAKLQTAMAGEGDRAG